MLLFIKNNNLKYILSNKFKDCRGRNWIYVLPFNNCIMQTFLQRNVFIINCFATAIACQLLSTYVVGSYYYALLLYSGRLSYTLGRNSLLLSFSRCKFAHA